MIWNICYGDLSHESKRLAKAIKRLYKKANVRASQLNLLLLFTWECISELHLSLIIHSDRVHSTAKLSDDKYKTPRLQ